MVSFYLIESNVKLVDAPDSKSSHFSGLSIINAKRTVK